MATDSGYTFTKSIKTIIIKYFETIRKNKDFANGRECRNLLEKVKIIQAKRILKNSSKECNLIKKCDIENAIKMNSTQCENKVIGFKV